MRSLKIIALCLLLAQVSDGVVTHETITFKTSIKKISGRVVGYGNVNPGVNVQLFDKPEVWADDSLSWNEKRKRQTEIASTVTESNGKFEFSGVPRGAYEIQFSRYGWKVLSVLVDVEPPASRKRLCVQMSIDGMGPEPSVQACH
jgi:Carboxypeptidase regulatory-like domain